MPLKVLPLLSQNSTRNFLDILIRRWQLKPGFRQILAGKTLQEIEQYLLDKKLLTADQLTQAFAQFYQLPFIHLTNRPITPSTVRLLDEGICRKYDVIAYDLQKNHLYLAVGRPAKLQQDAPSSLVKLRQEKGLVIHLAIAPALEVQAAVSKIFHSPAMPPHMPEAHAAPTPPLHPKHEHESEEKKHAPLENLVEKPLQASSHDHQPSVSPKEELPKDQHTDAAHRFFGRALSKEGLRQQIDPRKKEVDLTGLNISAEVLNRIPYGVAKKYKIIVFEFAPSKSKFEHDMIKVAVVRPDDLHVKEILNYIESRNKVLVDRYSTSDSSFLTALKRYPEAAKDTTLLEPAKPEPEKKTPDKPEGAVVKAEEVHLQPDHIAAAPALTDVPHEASKPPVTPVVADLPVNNQKPITVATIDIPEDGQPNSSTKPADSTVNPAPKVDQAPTKPAQAQSQLAPPEDGGITLSSDEIVNRPSAEQSVDELQRLAREQQNNLEDQDLDRLLKQPIHSAEDLAKVFKSGFIPEIVAATLFLAIQMKASDVHVEAGAETVRVRFRVDGILHDVIRVPHFLHAPLISRIKILSKMKIDEQRVPQDGRFDVVIDKRQVDLRVSTLPTVHGEKIVMRLLDKSEGVLSLEKMGVTGSNFDTLIANIDKPYGIILATGPTGSGKSTTLYAILSRISKPGVNIITLEDPVEYELPGINQAQVKPQIGFTFAEGLRSVLRQDPNVIMVGEIRDLETAAMATHAALTGHLVLSTLHTNDSAGALPRLINMGVEPFLITSSINAVVGQRLVRKICDQCREKVTIPPAVLKFVKEQLTEVSTGQLKNLNVEELVFYHGKGCANCTNGYRGRIGIFEVLAMSEKIEELAVRKAPASEIKKEAIKGGMVTMTQDGLIKALKGITTIDEVMRVTTTQIKELPE